MSADSSTSPLGLLGGAVASGVATALFPPARIPTRMRRSIHVGLGLAASGYVFWAMDNRKTSDPVRTAEPTQDPEEGPGRGLSLRPRLVIAGGLGAMVALSSVAGMGVDAAAERALVRRGVRHPRIWIGAATAAITTAMAWSDARPGPDGPDGSGGDVA